MRTHAYAKGAIETLTRAKSINSIDSIWHSGFVQSNGRLLCIFTTYLLLLLMLLLMLQLLLTQSVKLPNIKIEILIYVQWNDLIHCRDANLISNFMCMCAIVSALECVSTLKSWNIHKEYSVFFNSCRTPSRYFIRWTRFISWYYWHALTWM